MKTFTAKPSDIKRQWLLIDATDKTLGRLATEVAMILRGKNKPEYTPSMDTGDYVVIINAEKIAVTGNKRKDKIYHHHTGYIGGIKSISFEKLIATHPERAIEKAVKGMLPRTPLGRAMYKKLKVYAGENHPHTAQQPQAHNI
ncbi:50S ribosomal protein L13 [Francisella noatunensis]|uniref:Large ribosomal subunit protein uL13 n=4 Tax=Francisella TaxID=262 RepID=A0AAP6X6T7_9GAMM|nr:MULTISPECIES: 50S ribosomal protein L13 [Francisella]AFJ43001.1 50S ribosomal protein L13 [Francisella orientalis str. Toba 04]AHB98660.1 50S ribosomal protein L13 [Francisella orientalis LADL 07-285A]AJI52903.1 ribosomal protein L13 [Francisella philomiragia]AKN85908.1 50S ribosomal protein L13 [Francisella orientalis FNO12]AKN87447.1 50S ribosomal protein L13 [Francisella orientalis FNO24]